MPDVTRLRTEERENFALDLDEIAREGARRMLAQALEAEVADHLTRNQERHEHGRAKVVRNGKVAFCNNSGAASLTSTGSANAAR